MSLPYVKDSETSRAAAIAMADAMNGTRRKVHAFMVKMGDYGCTQQEAFKALGIPWNSISPRFGELEDDGFAYKKGETRLTDSGLEAEVYIGVGDPGECPRPPKKDPGRRILVHNVQATRKALVWLNDLALKTGYEDDPLILDLIKALT